LCRSERNYLKKACEHLTESLKEMHIKLNNPIQEVYMIVDDINLRFHNINLLDK
jgi:hypothetical protein